MMIRGYEIAGKTILMISVAIALVVAGALFVRSCDRRHSQAAQSRVDRSQGEAQRNSSADAINTVTNVGNNAAASEEMTRQNEKEIRNAPGANDPVNPGARDAGLRSLCRRPAYRGNPKCRVFESPAH
jgi:hypothetical protein